MSFEFFLAKRFLFGQRFGIFRFVVSAIAVLVILRHHANIRRLIAGTESRISL